MIGFSAGGIVTSEVVFGPGATRPDFAAIIYGVGEIKEMPNPGPPLLLAVAADDAFAAGRTIDLFTAYRKGKGRVELHVFQMGAHGFVSKGGGSDRLHGPPGRVARGQQTAFEVGRLKETKITPTDYLPGWPRRSYRQILLAARPEGLPKPSDFRLVETPIPDLAEGQFLVKINYLSVDPYMRGRISEAKSYADPVQIGEIMVGDTVGTVVESRHTGYRPGEVVVGYWGWHEYTISDGQGVERFDTALAPMSTALGVLGMPGMTAYFGFLEIGWPIAGETVFVSGPAGAVGSLVGQIAKIKGCRAVGSGGSFEKVALQASWVSTRPSTTRKSAITPQHSRRSAPTESMCISTIWAAR